LAEPKRVREHSNPPQDRADAAPRRGFCSAQVGAVVGGIERGKLIVRGHRIYPNEAAFRALDEGPFASDAVQKIFTFL
jgi:hypothetical protein